MGALKARRLCVGGAGRSSSTKHVASSLPPWKSPTGDWASRVLRRGAGSVEAAE